MGNNISTISEIVKGRCQTVEWKGGWRGDWKRNFDLTNLRDVRSTNREVCTSTFYTTYITIFSINRNIKIVLLYFLSVERE